MYLFVHLGDLGFKVSNLSLYFAELVSELLTLFLFFVRKGLFLFYYYLFFDLFTLFYLSEGGDGSLFQIEINIAEILLDCMVLELIDLVGKASEEVTVLRSAGVPA